MLKNQHATALKKILYNLSLYVETVAQGDPAIVPAAGFIPSKQMREPVGLSPKPNDLRAQVRDAGTQSVHVRVNAWKHARYYQFEFRKVGSGEEWTRILSTRSKIHISGLDYLNEYEFRVSYLGSNPTLNYSDIVRCAVV
ncbi:fibronectin type III domain-containing protein [Parapedobacter soli]|uniref:fibronectin type III domain-containing protein n=1 Tax=Parapedobacter soli TaxID=416955 RepID=UPI0021C6CB6A|nr:fibronectin type III domain-containing protein [Parapedobacter soli]